jgi:negative elongation factor A
LLLFYFSFFLIENPRPEQGSLIAIKLNEGDEIILTGNGQQQRVVAELYFEMNYDTGEYRKVKKYRSPA